jgi:flavin reductase (DIM6/NTAB) family NADH-FMN oxidoreductase RutF
MYMTKLDQKYSPYQMPCVIIGSIVDDKPNFMICTWVSRVNRNPPLWIASINKKHYTMIGIKEKNLFSINFPSEDLIKKVDYIGITSGRDKDKSSLFEIFYGELNVPLIKDCTTSIELKVKKLIELSDHYIVLGRAINSYIGEAFQTNGIPDMKKMKPIIYTGAKRNPTYWILGEKLGDAFKLGKEFYE